MIEFKACFQCPPHVAARRSSYVALSVISLPHALILAGTESALHT